MAGRLKRWCDFTFTAFKIGRKSGDRQENFWLYLLRDIGLASDISSCNVSCYRVIHFFAGMHIQHFGSH
jgi:hypothetical protein